MNFSSQENPGIMNFRYKFTFSDGSTKAFDINLDGTSLALMPKPRKSFPDWTQLSYHKCPNCPLSDAKHPRCPIAANLADVAEAFRESISFDEADIEITTQARVYNKHTSLQIGISSLIGITMVTSGCPIMDKLKPMVRTHLPFATHEETVYRAISMYLLAQYFMMKKGKEPDWELKKLLHTYEQIRIVNHSFCRRLSSSQMQDAVLNAVVRLNAFAEIASLAIQENGLSEIEQLFAAYFNE